MEDPDENSPPTPRTNTVPNPPGETPSEVVVREVAALQDEDPTALDPLYGAVDPDALDGIFVDADAGEDLTARFRYCDYLVTVTPESVAIRGMDTDG
jgi:hypothetical protein